MDRVGFVGLGTMGAAMAANVARAGFPLTVWNRTEGRAAPLLELGATEAQTPASLASAVDVVVSCVTDTPDLEEILFGPTGIADASPPPALVVDCSTVSPEATRQFARRLDALGTGMVDAPVSGGSEGALKGTLTIFVGGEPRNLERARPVLEAMGKTITHMGSSGAGQAAKAVNQVIIAGTYVGVAEGLILAMKEGLDLERLVTALSGGAAQSWVLANRSERMIANDYPLGFKVALHRKDLGIALEMAERAGAQLPVSELAAALEDELIRDGHADEDVSAVARAIRARAGL